MPDRKWYISFTPGKSGRWTAWASEKPPPLNASIRTMLTFPGEVHFAIGPTVEKARSLLESELPDA